MKKYDIRIIHVTVDGKDKFRVDVRTHNPEKPDWYNWNHCTICDTIDNAKAEMAIWDAIYNGPQSVIIEKEVLCQL